jgi:hypothetical protein
MGVLTVDRIVVDVQTGAVTVVALTPAEIAEINARPPEPAPPAPTLAEVQAQLSALQAQITALTGK